MTWPQGSKAVNLHTMTDVRYQVDTLDAQLVPLLLQRLQCMRAAAQIKSKRDQVRDDQRVAAVLDHVKQRARQLGADASDVEAIEAIYSQLIEFCIGYELRHFDQKCARQEVGR